MTLLAVAFATPPGNARAEAAPAPAADEILGASDPAVSPFELNGFVHVVVERASDRAPTFELEHALVRATGRPTAATEVVAELIATSKAHQSSDSASTQAEFRLLQAYGRYTFHRAARLRAGKLLVPFSVQDTVYYCSTRPTNEHPFALTALLFDHWVDTGIALDGRIDVGPTTLHYDLGVFNGPQELHGASTDGQDNNGDKMPVARLELSHGELWRLGASYARARYAADERNVLVLTDVHADLALGDVTLRVAGLRRFAGTDAGDAVRNAWFAEATWWIRPGALIQAVVPVARVDVVQRRGIETAPLESEMTLGASVELDGAFRVLTDGRIRWQGTRREPGVSVGLMYAF